MWNFIFLVLFILNTLLFVSGDYPCLCAYQIETPVFKSQNNESSILGYLYEFDCKPTFPLDNTRNSDFIAIQFEGQIGYITNTPGVLAIESCPGNISSIDEVLATTSYSSTMKTTPITTHIRTTSPTTTLKPSPMPTTTFKPSTMPTKTPNPSTMPTTTSKPSTMPTKTPNPSTMPTTTSKPWTMPTTTKSSTLPTTTSKPSTMPTTTSKPSTLPTTNSKPSALPTTTAKTISASTTPPTTTAIDPSLTCPDGWILYGVRCYAFHFDHKHSHSTAENICTHDGSQLVNINSQEEQNMIANHLRLLNAYHSTVWTGGMWQNGAWVWPNQLFQSNHSNYVNWNTEFPHYHPSSGLCVGVMGSQNFTWRDFHCSNRYNYICEKPANNPTTSSATPVVSSNNTSTSPPSTSGLTNSTTQANITRSTAITLTNSPVYTERCPEHWLKYRSSCYLVILNEHRSHSFAESRCHEQNSHLVYIESEGEQRALEGFLHGYHQYEINSEHGHGHESAVWTGGLMDGSHGSHGWVWGNTPITYTNWEAGYPQQGDERCVAIIGHYDSRWKDYLCDDHFNYICERSVFHTPALVG